METRFTSIQKALREKWKPEWSGSPVLSPLDKSVRAMVQAMTALQVENAATRAEGSLTPKGARDKARVQAKERAVPALWRAAMALEASQAALKQQRASLCLPVPDNGNAAEAALRSEARSWLRGLRETQAAAALFGDKVDLRIIQAVIEAPAVLSGISDKMRGDVERHAVQRLFGEQLADLDKKEEAVALASSAIGIGMYQLKVETDLTNEPAFNKWMAEATASSQSEDIAPEVRPILDLSVNVTELMDEVFARALPEMYPDHPVNKVL